MHVAIIGAGISGLSLARCLRHRGIRFSLFERETAEAAAKRHRYGIVLRPRACASLLETLDLGGRADVFRENVAVVPSQATGAALETFRADRQRFEALLNTDLDVKYAHKLVDVKDETGKLHLEFENGERYSSDVVVAADGVHSALRDCLELGSELKVLPYAVYRGKRRLRRNGGDVASFDRFRESLLTSQNNTLAHRRGKVLLQIILDSLDPEEMEVTYTFSRPAGESSDPIFDPRRPKSGARETPSALFDEIAGLDQLQGLFAEVFNVEKMKQDRLLNWLMRSVLVNGSWSTQMVDMAKKQPVVFLGDAAHGAPILGSEGANAAVEDAIELAHRLAEGGRQGLISFVEKRLPHWKAFVEEGERRLEKMHSEPTPNL